MMRPHPVCELDSDYCCLWSMTVLTLEVFFYEVGVNVISLTYCRSLLIFLGNYHYYVPKIITKIVKLGGSGFYISAEIVTVID